MVAPATSDPTSADVVTSAVVNEEGAHNSDTTTPTNEEKQEEELGTQGISAVVTAPVPRGGEEGRKTAPLEDAASTVEVKAVATAGQEIPADCEAEATPMARGTPEEGAQAREKEECAKLVNLRAEKILLVKGE